MSELSECFYECVLIFWQNLGARLAAMTVEKNFILLKVEVKFCFGGKLRGVAKCVSLKVRFANPIIMMVCHFFANHTNIRVKNNFETVNKHHSISIDAIAKIVVQNESNIYLLFISGSSISSSFSTFHRFTSSQMVSYYTYAYY